MGEGASFDVEDYGQVGNPCGDPVDEGGSLRSQDVLTDGDPLGLDGTVVRVDPDTGEPAPGSPDRIAAHGLRNPFRFTFRPRAAARGRADLWISDVGGSRFEEINRVPRPGRGPTPNFGWPCFEGAGRNAAFDGLDLPICEGLYRQESTAQESSGQESSGRGGVSAPVFSYRTRGGEVADGDGCPTGTSSVSGVEFLGAAYPRRYRGALVFSDFARECVWVLLPGRDGLPDPDRVRLLVGGARSPVDLTTGPDGDLYYVSYGTDERGYPVPGNGAVRRVRHYPGNRPPTVRLRTTGDAFGAVPLDVRLSAAGTRDPEGGRLDYDWDLDGDGVFGDARGRVVEETYTEATNVRVTVRVTDRRGASGTASTWLYPGNTPPRLTIASPTAGDDWAVGEWIEMAATAYDAEDGDYAGRPDRFSWSVTIRHCPSICHSHPLTTYGATDEAGVLGPDHEHPSTLLLTASVVDDRGMTTYESVEIVPRTSKVRLRSRPRGVPLTASGHPPGSGRLTYLEGGRLTVSAPERRRVRAGRVTKVLRFERWSDGGEPVHEVVAEAGGVDLVAVYRVVRRIRR